MELKPCKKMATAVSMIFMLLLLLTIGGQGAAIGDECSVIVGRSRTFKGDCQSTALCVSTCRGEGYKAGYCFKDVADPDHRVCLCTKPCPPPAATTTASPGNMVE